MKVAQVTKAFFSAFADFFPDLEVISAVKNSKEYKAYDLVIFTGGEDIEPSIYGRENKYSMTNKGRDIIEKDALRHYFVNTTAKIIGVCRGHQLINACFGGDLYQDLYYKGINHGGVHGFDILMPTAFIPKRVNSMHHQGVFNLGSDFRALATYKGISECAVKTDNRIITVQWHPEFMEDHNFFDWIKAWVAGKEKLDFTKVIQPKEYDRYVKNFITNDEHVSFGDFVPRDSPNLTSNNATDFSYITYTGVETRTPTNDPTSSDSNAFEEFTELYNRYRNNTVNSSANTSTA